MKKIFLLLLITFISCSILQAQKKFNVAVSKISDTKVKVEWMNPFGDSVVQLNVQRSWDSVRNFRTVFVPLSPTLPQNGYIDETGMATSQYYRIFYVLGDGTFFFTQPKKVSTGSDFTNEVAQEKPADTSIIYTVHDDDTTLAVLNYRNYKHFRDSIVRFTKDTLYSLSEADILIRYYNNNISWVASTKIYTTTNGYVQINLPDATDKNYRIKFFDERHKSLFSIQHVDKPKLILDKTDFLRSGWFFFELYEGGQIKERNKFYIPKDF